MPPSWPVDGPLARFWTFAGRTHAPGAESARYVRNGNGIGGFGDYAKSAVPDRVNPSSGENRDFLTFFYRSHIAPFFHQKVLGDDHEQVCPMSKLLKFECSFTPTRASNIHVDCTGLLVFELTSMGPTMESLEGQHAGCNKIREPVARKDYAKRTCGRCVSPILRREFEFRVSGFVVIPEVIGKFNLDRKHVRGAMPHQWPAALGVDKVQPISNQRTWACGPKRGEGHSAAGE